MLPAVLSDTDLPLAELHAARLQGELYLIGGCFAPVDRPADRGMRAAAIVAIAPARFIADRLTAAWVWGAPIGPPARHQFCIDIQERLRLRWATRFAVREVVIAAAEIGKVGALRITTPLRTAQDIARDPERPDAAAVQVVAGLCTATGLAIADCITAIDEHPGLAYSRVARRRLLAAKAELDATRR